MATPLTFEYRVEGVLTPISPGPVTLGITRDLDDATVLAAGTATSNPSIGSYTYDATSLALSTALAYSVTWTYADVTGTHIVIDTIEAADATRTLGAYRANVQYELGRFLETTTTAESATVLSLVCGGLASSMAGPTTYGGYYVHISSGDLAGQERQVPSAGFANATGTFQVDRAFSALPALGVSVELAARLPATAMDGVRGVNYAINWALQRTWYPDRIALVPVAGQKFYSLQTWAHWFDRDIRIGRLWEASADALSNPQAHDGGAWMRYDGELPMLEIEVPFQASDTIFYLSVLRPGHTWVKSGGSWSETHIGLDQDSDEALVSPNLVTQMALVQCYRQLANASTGGDRQAWLSEVQAQATKAVMLRNAMLDQFQDGAAGKSGNRRATPYPSLVLS